MVKSPDGLVLSAHVALARAENLPLVALESTVLTHGLPYPQNLETFHALEDAIRAAGATPATIIVLNGQAHIGLDESLVDALAESLRTGKEFRKLGLRDLALAFSSGASGGTTVSATMKLAALSGIEIFATGGIGGVHRGWPQTLDVSSDLTALAQIPVVVISAGSKAILDIPATLEYLETLAVPVLGWQTESFPLFYTRDSTYMVDKLTTPEEFVSFYQEHLKLGGKGILIANPIPLEHSIPATELEPHIQSALQAAHAKGISGKALTPFLLDFLATVTKGDSVKANLALLKNNTLLAAKLAVALKGRMDR